MSKNVGIPLCMGSVELGRDQARAAAKRHRGCRTHERALTHGSAVGGGQSVFHDVSFENRWFVGLILMSQVAARNLAMD